MWVPAGQHANTNRWRYDMAKQLFMPPGTPGQPKGIQVEMPMNYTGAEPRGFHMVASPAGTQAPIEHINYTPATGEVHGRGVAAPPNLLNYTLLPAEALQVQDTPAMAYFGAGQGQGSSPAMGAGAVGALDAMGPANVQPFAGTPPLANSPNMLGPSPTTNRAAPQWGGGGTPFASRMGMGADGEEDTSVFTSADTQTVGGATGPAQGPAPVAGNPQGNAPKDPRQQAYWPKEPVRDARGVPTGVWAPVEIGQTVPLYDDTTVPPRQVGFKVLDSMGPDLIEPKWSTHFNADPASLKPEYHFNDDGSVDVLDPRQTDPSKVITRVKDPSPEMLAAANADRQLKIAQAKTAQAKGDTAVQLAQAELQTAQSNAAAAASQAQEAAIKAGQAGQPPKPTPSAEIVDRSGQVYVYNPDTQHYDPTGLFKQAGNWTTYTDPKTQTTRLYNPDTKEDVELAPLDPYKEYPPQKGANGAWIQWDPTTKNFKKVYQEDPNWETQWSGDQLIRVNKQSGQVQKIWQKTPTQAEDDAHTTAIDNHNRALIDIEKTKQDLQVGKITAADARIRMENTIQTLLHPMPTISGGTMLIPAGVTVNSETFDPFTGKTGHISTSGGPVDPRIQQAIDEATQMMQGFNLNQGDTSSTPPPSAQGGLGRTPGGSLTADTSQMSGGVGEQLTDQGQSQTQSQSQNANVPGWPGRDARLSGNAQPPTTRTVQEGGATYLVTYDSGGNEVSRRNISTASNQPTDQAQGGDTDRTAVEGESQDTYFDPVTGKRVPIGTGNQMGAGMAAGTTGWTPRPGMVNPATGPGFLGAGQGEDLDAGEGGGEQEQYYDANGNPVWEPNDIRQAKFRKGFEAAQEANRATTRVDYRPGEEMLRSAELEIPIYDPRNPAMQEVANPGFHDNPDELIYLRHHNPADPQAGGGQFTSGTEQPEIGDPNDTSFDWPYFDLKRLAGGKIGNDPEYAGWLMGRRNNINNAQETPLNLGPDVNTGPNVQTPGHAINTGPQAPTPPNITTLPLPIAGGHMPGPQVQLPNVSDQGAQWVKDLGGVVKHKVNEGLGEIMGWPTLEEAPKHPLDPNTYYGSQGGHDVPEVNYLNPQTPGRTEPPMEPTDIDEGQQAYGLKSAEHNLPGQPAAGMTPEDMQDIQQNQGLGSVYNRSGAPTDPTAEQIQALYRKLTNPTGTGQEEAPDPLADARAASPWRPWGPSPETVLGTLGRTGGNVGDMSAAMRRMRFSDITPGALGTGQAPAPGTMPPSVSSPSDQTPPQGPGSSGQPLPQWLLTLLRNHPELLQMAGLGGGAQPSAGWTPPGVGTGQEGPPSTPPGVGAPSPGGGPMIPPVDPSNVAGIGHRFGQPMNVGEPQHSGVDLQAPEGTPTQSPVDGYVQRVENNPGGLGLTVIIRGMDGSEHRLGHLKETDAYAGMQVKMGQDLGSPVGDTGMTTGAHLHWGVRDQGGQPSDPTAALGSMASMPPVPGTEMMGPPGGVGGTAQTGQPQMPPSPMGGGQERGRVGWRRR